MQVDLRDALRAAGEPTDTDALNSHPVNRLWASKIHDLAGMGFSSGSRYADAYNWALSQLEAGEIVALVGAVVQNTR